MAASSSQRFLQTGSLDFTDYVTKNLQPTAEANKKAGELVDGLATFLKEKTSFRVSKVVKGGSFGKGTQIRNKSDVDLVFFIEDFEDKKCALETLNKELDGWNSPQYVQIERLTPFGAKIKYRIRTGDPFTDIDILPTQDHLAKGKQATYAEMAAASASKRQDYSASLASLQIEFVSKRPAPVKNLIRLVKHWRKTYFTERSEKGNKLPTSYPLELIVIHLWEKAGRPASFKLDRAFKTVMEALANNHTLDVQWTDNYQAHEFAGEISRLKESQRRNRRPFVLDPANPFNDVAARFEAWPEVAEVARKALGSPALTSVRAGW